MLKTLFKSPTLLVAVLVTLAYAVVQDEPQDAAIQLAQTR